MDTQIQFEENDPIRPVEQHTGMAGWLMRKGFAKTLQQANIILLIIAIICIIAAVFVIFWSQSGSSGEYTGPYMDPDEDIL